MSGTDVTCPHTMTNHEPIRSNECTCCGRYMAQFWLCDDCEEVA
jgi:hypothetical protein